MTKRKIEGGVEICHKKIKKQNENVEIITKKRKHYDYSPSPQPNKKCKIDVILHDENMSDYIKKRRDMLIYT